MNLRRLLPCLALLLCAVASFAQLTAEDKRDVLRGMDQVLTEDAFVPGVDLDNWKTFLDGRQDALASAQTPIEFVMVVNRALSEFGISHIKLLPDSSGRRSRRYRGAFLQDFRQTRRYPSALEPIRWVDDHSAVMRLRSFDEGYYKSEIDEAFNQVKDADYLVLDLRHNPGGELSNLFHFLSKIVPADKPVGTFVSRRLAREYQEAGLGDGKDPVAIANWASRKFQVRATDDAPPFKGKIAVLIDRRSASASEIVAAAAREILSSPLLGDQSAGAVLMSTFSRLPHGFKMQFPVSDYVSIKGVRLEGNPLQPDQAAPDGESGVAAALDYVKGGQALSTIIEWPFWRAQWAQQNISVPTSTPWPMTLQPQWLQVGASL